MTDVALQRAQQHRALGVTALAVGGQQRLRLDRVTELGAGAVGLDGVKVGGRQTGVGEGLADDPLLGGSAGRRQSVGGAVLVDGGAAQDRQDVVAVALGVGEPLVDEHAHALGPAGAVGRVGEGLAAAVVGQGALGAEFDEARRGGHDGHTADQGDGALARAQGLGREMQGDQRRGARRVDGDRGPLESEGVGDAAGQEAGRLGRLPLSRLGRRPVVAAAASDVDAGGAPPQGRRVDARPLQCLPGGFEHDALLRVHHDGLARRDAEHGGVEVGGVVEEAAVPGGAAAAAALRRAAEQGVEVPAAVGGELAHASVSSSTSSHRSSGEPTPPG